MSRQQISILWSMPLHTHRGYVLVRSKRRIGAKTMTDKKSFADKVCAPMAPQTGTMPTPRPTAQVGLLRSCTAGPRGSPSRSPP